MLQHVIRSSNPADWEGVRYFNPSELHPSGKRMQRVIFDRGATPQQMADILNALRRMHPPAAERSAG